MFCLSATTTTTAQQLSPSEMRNMLNTYCTKEAQLSYSMALLISGGNPDVAKNGLTANECEYLQRRYQQSRQNDTDIGKEADRVMRRQFIQDEIRRIYCGENVWMLKTV